MFPLITRARQCSRRRGFAHSRAWLPISLMAHAALSAAATRAASAVESADPTDTADTAFAPVHISVQSAPRASSLAPNLPATVNTVNTVTADQFQYWNVTSAEDVLKYAPNLAVRKRFIGDLNSTIAVRGASNAQTARGLVYADGLLLGNSLGNMWNFAPRWLMIFADDIERTDVIYGPYSALYAGNSIGATVAITTRMPTQFAWPRPYHMGSPSMASSTH